MSHKPFHWIIRQRNEDRVANCSLYTKGYFGKSLQTYQKSKEDSRDCLVRHLIGISVRVTKVEMLTTPPKIHLR